MNSGYILVDATSLDILDTEEQTIPGIYAKILAASKTGKLVLLGGTTSGEVHMSPLAVTISPVDTSADDAIYIELPDHNSAVTPNDKIVAITNSTPSEPGESETPAGS